MQHLNTKQVNRLIDFVKEKKWLYDKMHNRYKQMDLREVAWGEIATELNVEVSDCKTAWRSLRDQFQKALKKFKDGEKPVRRNRQYVYFEKLLFLKDFVHSRPRRAIARDINQEEWLDEEAISEFSIAQNQDSISSTYEHKYRTSSAPQPEVKRLQTLEEEEEQEDNEDDFVDPLSVNTDKRCELEGIDHFFLSLSSLVKRYNLTHSGLAHFQCTIMNVVTSELEKLKNTK